MSLKLLQNLRNLSKCAQFKHMYLKNSGIYYIPEDKEIFPKSLKTLDLSRNLIYYLDGEVRIL